MVWLRDHQSPALSTRHTCCDAFRVVWQRWGQCEHLELYELRHASASLLMERGLGLPPTHFGANQLGHTDGGALVQRLSGHPSVRSIRDQIRLAFSGHGEQKRSRPHEKLLEMAGFRSVSHPPSPY